MSQAVPSSGENSPFQGSTRPLLAGLLAMLLLMCTGLGIGIYQMQQMAVSLDDLVRKDDRSREAINTIQRISRERALILTEVVGMEDAFGRDEKLLAFHLMATGFRAAQDQLASLMETPNSKLLLNQQQRQIEELVRHFDRIVSLIQQDQREAARELLHTIAIPLQNQALDTLRNWTDSYYEQHDNLVRDMRQRQQLVGGMMLGAGLVSILVGLLVAAMVYRWNRRLIARFAENDIQLRTTIADLAFRQAAMDAHSIVSVADASGRITHVNDKFCEVSGYQRDELIGANHRIVKSDFHPPEFFRDMWTTISSGRIWRGEVKNRAKNGHAYWVETTIVPMLDEDGLPIRYISVRTEITNIMEMQETVRQANLILKSNVVERTHELEQAKQQLEQELLDRVNTQNALQQSFDELQSLHRQLQETQQYLMQSEKLAAVGQLAAGMAHEINNPIGFVSSNLATLGRYQETLDAMLARYRQIESGLDASTRAAIVAQRKEADLDFLLEDARALLEESRSGVERVRKIVQDLRDFSRVDSAGQWQWMDINHSLETTLNLLGERFTEGVSIQRDFGQLPLVECHPGDLNQVFISLLNNALQAVNGNGCITLRSGLEGEHVWVEIEDTGEGMSEEVRGHIFDPFFTTRPVGQGAGLGLSLAYGILKKHGGQISATSKMGIGSVFRITLPMRQRDVISGEDQKTYAI